MVNRYNVRVARFSMYEYYFCTKKIEIGGMVGLYTKNQMQLT